MEGGCVCTTTPSTQTSKLAVWFSRWSRASHSDVFLQLSWYSGGRKSTGRERDGRNFPPQRKGKRPSCPPGPDSHPHPELPTQRPHGPCPPGGRSCRGGRRPGAAGRGSLPRRPPRGPSSELRTPRASGGCEAGAAASPASLPLPRPAGSIRITSWSKYAGQPENQSRHNQRLVNCNVAETHPSHPLLSPLSPPQPSAFRTIKDSIIGERKI